MPRTEPKAPKASDFQESDAGLLVPKAKPHAFRTNALGTQVPEQAHRVALVWEVEGQGQDVTYEARAWYETEAEARAQGDHDKLAGKDVLRIEDVEGALLHDYGEV